MSRFFRFLLFSTMLYSGVSFSGTWHFSPPFSGINMTFGSTGEFQSYMIQDCLANYSGNDLERPYACKFASSKIVQEGNNLRFILFLGESHPPFGQMWNNRYVNRNYGSAYQFDARCPNGTTSDGMCLPSYPEPQECEVGDEITRPTYSPPGGSPTPTPQICSNQCLYDFDRRSSIGLEEPGFPGVGKYTAYYLGNGQSCTEPTPPETPPDPTEPPPPDPVDPTDPTDPDEPGGGSGGGDGGGSGGNGTGGGSGGGGGGDGGGSGGNGTGGGSGGGGGGDGGGGGGGGGGGVGGGGGSGNGDGEEEGENTGTASGSCDKPPSSSGDPLLGAILHQQWLTMCHGEELKPSDVSSSLSEAGFTNADQLDGYLADNAENIDSKVTGIVSGVFTSGPSNSCPLKDDIFYSRKWGTIRLPWSMSCPIFNVISAVMFWFSYLAAGWILFNSLARSD